MTVNRNIDYPVSRMFAGYYDGEIEPVYSIARPITSSEAEAAIWRRMDEIQRVIRNLAQRCNAQDKEIDTLRLALDRMTAKTPAGKAAPPVKREDREKPKTDPRSGTW